MNSNQSKSKIGRLILVFSLLFGVAMVSSTTAQAQYPWPDDRRDRDRDYRRDRDRDRDNRRDRDRDRDRDNRGYGRGGYGNVYRIAQDRGYQDGLNTGANDARRGQSYDPQRSHYYRNATYGYDSSYGNREAYRQAYRSGFVSGYREGFQRYGGNRRRNNGRWFPNWP
jgi:hypothetical protein